MADNVLIESPETGVPYALDDIDGVLHQRAKVQFGEPGTAVDVSDTNPLPVSVGGVSTEATLSALNALIDALSAKITVCNTGAVALDAATLAALEAINAAISGTVTVSNFTDNGLTDAQLRAQPVQVAGSFAAAPPDNSAALMSALRALVHPIWEEAASGRLRVVLDPIGGGQTLGTVSTVGTVANMTSLNQVAAVPANSFIYDQMHAAWAGTVRRAVA